MVKTEKSFQKTEESTGKNMDSMAVMILEVMTDGETTISVKGSGAASGLA